MSDIVERLRAWEPMVSSGYECPAAGPAMTEAADTITALRDEIERLRAERDIVDASTRIALGKLATAETEIKHLRAALAQEKQ